MAEAMVATVSVGPHWTSSHPLAKSRSVVQTLRHFELGIPYFSNNGNILRTTVIRQLFNSRAVVSDSTAAVMPPKVQLKDEKTRKPEKKWIQIEVPEKTEIGVTDDRIWTRTIIGSVRPNANSGTVAREQFYFIEPSDSVGGAGLRPYKFMYSNAIGKLHDAFVLKWGTNCEKTTPQFVTLIQPGILRSFDLNNNRVKAELKLRTEVCRNVSGFTSMSVFDNCKRIFVFGTDQRKKGATKAIIVLHFPPWKDMAVIHVEIPDVKISMEEGVFFILDKKRNLLHITTWGYVRRQIVKMSSVSSVDTSNRTAFGQPTVTFEGKISELPTVLCSVNLSSTLDPFFGLMNIISVPMFYAMMDSGLCVFEINKGELNSIYKFESTSEDPEEVTTVYPLDDDSARALIYTHFSAENTIVKFQKEWDAARDRNIVTTETLREPLTEYWSKQRQADNQQSAPTPSSSQGKRPRRACVKKIHVEPPPKIGVLGISFCVEMELFAVLTADEEVFHVAIYNGTKLELVRALPAVLVWPRLKNSEANAQRELINETHISFTPEMVYVCFKYMGGRREAFISRLLTESQSTDK